LTGFNAGYIALIGKPNVGKSTLVNGLLNYKLSITSFKPQTTRRKIMGIMSGESYQAIFLDTPGIIEPRYLLQKAMVDQVQSSIADADIIAYIADVSLVKNAQVSDTINHDIEIIHKLPTGNKPVILVLNKIDLIDVAEILPVTKVYNDQFPFKQIIPVSALKNNGLDVLGKELVALLPEHPPYYDPDIITDHPERFIVSELIREQIFNYFQQEIPYTTEVQIEEFKERETGKDLIRAIIYTERETQKAILIGKKGLALKKIGQNARTQIEKLLGRSVYLDLRVKVRKDWRRDQVLIKKFGYI
jgi:GTP-binding protein Era